MKSTSRFDEAAAQWDSNPTRIELARAIGAAICRTVPLQANWRALDYGAGTGLLTLNLQPRLGSILALDASTGMLAQLQQKLANAGIGNVQARHWNLETQSSPESGFDLAVSAMTLHHLRDVPLVFQRLAELLKPGGWLAVADLDREDGSFHSDQEGVFHAGFERPQVVAWLTAAGFEPPAIHDAHTVVKPGPAGEPRTYGVFLAVAQKTHA